MNSRPLQGMQETVISSQTWLVFCVSKQSVPSRERDWLTGSVGLQITAKVRDVRRILKVASSVLDRVIDIVASQLGVSKEQITPETSFINDLGADSLDTVELVMELEEEFEINIPDDAAEKIQTVGQAVEFIEKQQA